MLDNMKIELGKYYHFDDLRRRWEENYPEAEPLTMEFLEENLSNEIGLYPREGNYVAFHLKSLGDISQITEGTFTVERCKIDFKNPKIFSNRVNVCGIDQGSHTDGIVLFQDSDKNFFVELEDGEGRRCLVNIKRLFQGVGDQERKMGYRFHFPARGVVIKNNTLSVNRAAHNADCRPNFGRMDFSQNSVYQLVTSEDTYRPINTQPPQGMKLTVFDKPYLSVENLSRRMYGNSNCTFVYAVPQRQSSAYHQKYQKLLSLAFRFPDPSQVFAYEKTEAVGYGTMALLGNSLDKIAANYDQYTENFAKNFRRLFGEDLNLEALRKHRIYIELFHSDAGADTRDATLQSFTIDPPKKHEKECVIRPCWLGYEGQPFTGGRYQNVLFKDALLANLTMSLLAFAFGKTTNEEEESREKKGKNLVPESFEEGRKAFAEMKADLEAIAKDEKELLQFASYCDLLQVPFTADIVKAVRADNDYNRPHEIEEILELTEKILSTPLSVSVADEIGKLNDERLLKYFRLDQRPVGTPGEYCRQSALIYNIPLTKEDIPVKIAQWMGKLENLKFTLSDGSKIRLRECIMHLAELVKIKWAEELEKTYEESIQGIERSGFQYQKGISFHLSSHDEALLKHFSDQDFYRRIESFLAGFCEMEIERLSQMDLFRMAQIFLPVVCAEESQNFALLQKRREGFYFAPQQESASLNKRMEKLTKRTKISLRQARQILDSFPKTKEKYCVDTFLVPMSETFGEILLNLLSLVKEFRSHFPDMAKSWESFTKLYRKQPRSQTLQEWQTYCKEKDSSAPPTGSSFGAETCEIELKKAADEIRKNQIAAPREINLKAFKPTIANLEEMAKTRTKLPTLLKELMQCNKKTFRLEDWVLLIQGMSYYLALVGEPGQGAVEMLLSIFEKELTSYAAATEEMRTFQKNFAKFWQPEPVVSQTPSPLDEEGIQTMLGLYGNWLTRVEALLADVRDCERIEAAPIDGYRLNEDLYGQYSANPNEKTRPQVNSFVFYVFSGEGVHILHKFMAKHINHSIMLKNVDKDGKVGFPKGYRSQIHFLDIDKLLAVVFGGADSPSYSKELHEIARRPLSGKLITPLGLAILGSYRCSADNKVSFTKGSEVELDPYDLIATSSVGPELENQVAYPFIGELVASVEDARPVLNLTLEKGLVAPQHRLYFVPAPNQKSAYFQISKTGGNVNIWKREVSRSQYGCAWLPQRYFFLGCFEFPQFEKEMELYLLPFVSATHRKRQDRVAVLFKMKRENTLYAQPLGSSKLPAKILKLWDKDHDSASDAVAYPSEFFDGKVFILKELWPKCQTTTALSGQNHFQRFLSLAEISLP